MWEKIKEHLKQLQQRLRDAERENFFPVATLSNADVWQENKGEKDFSQDICSGIWVVCTEGKQSSAWELHL